MSAAQKANRAVDGEVRHPPLTEVALQGAAKAPIIVIQRPLEETRTPSGGCLWLAECEVAGKRFEARSRHGAANALARELVEAGIADTPLEVHFEGIAGCLRWGSFGAAATRTYTEGNRPLQCIRRIAPQDAMQTIRAPPKQGVEEPAGTVVPLRPGTTAKRAA
jgi:hypothetical protein